MSWVILYLVGAFITAAIIGLLDRMGNSKIQEDDYGSIRGVILLWPLVWILTLFIGFPMGLFMLCKGDADHLVEPIKEWWKGLNR